MEVSILNLKAKKATKTKLAKKQKVQNKPIILLKRYTIGIVNIAIITIRVIPILSIGMNIEKINNVNENAAKKPKK